jgi:hypothetical protein
MSFDIGPSGDLAIFTNNDDMFNISTDVGPSFILNQGFDRGVADVGMSQNVTGDVIADMPNEAPIDFINYNSSKSVADLNTQRPSRQKMDSFASDATIEAEPIKKKKSHSQGSQGSQPPAFPSYQQPAFPSYQQPQPQQSQPAQKVLSHPPAMQDDDQADTPPNIGINLGFDDLLDNRKLKPVNDIIDDAASIGGDSQSTIKHGGYEYPSEPNSPTGFKPVSGDIPDSPLPSTFQKDRDRKKRSPETGSGSAGYSQQQSYQQPQQSYQQPSYQEPPQQVYEETPKYINEDDEKMDLLLKLKSLEERGKIVPSKHYNMKSNIDEVRMEYRNQTGILEMQASVSFMRKGLIFCTSGMEYMNRRFDPVGAKLDGWGESIMENMMDYDGIFERLHGKYKGSMEMEPEMELLFALAGSAFQFHLSQTFFKSAIPQLGQVLRENPSVIDGFMKVAQEAAKRAAPQGAMPGGMQGGYGGPMPSNDIGVGGGIGGYGGGGGNMQSPGIDFGALLGQVGITSGALSDFAKTMGNPPPPAQSTRDYREPPVNDLYRQMMQNQQDNSDALSISSETSDRSGKRSTKAVITPIPTSRRGGGGNVIKLV